MKTQKPKLPFMGEITIYNVMQYAYKNLAYAVLFFVLFAVVGYSQGDTRHVKYQVKANVRVGMEDNGELKYKIAVFHSFFRQIEAYAQKKNPEFYPHIRYGEGRITSQEILLTGDNKEEALSDMVSLLSHVGKRLEGLEKGLFRSMKISDTKGKSILFAIDGMTVSSHYKGRSAGYKAIAVGMMGFVLGWVFASFVTALQRGKKMPKT